MREERIDLRTMPLEVLRHNVPENPDVEHWAGATEAIAQGGVVVIPWSGGLDSTTAAMWALEDHLFHQVVLFSVTMGQPWDAGERRARSFIMEDNPLLGQATHVEMRLPTIEGGYRHIQPGRNFEIIKAAHDVGMTHGEWGEIWLAWLDGEITLATGDKSRAGLAYMGERLAERVGPTLTRRPFRLVIPTQRDTKASLVRWWMERGWVAKAANLYSCFVGGPQPCGQCQACFRFWVGFAANGAASMLSWNHRINFDAHIDKYENKAYTSPRRRADTLKAIERYRNRELHDR